MVLFPVVGFKRMMGMQNIIHEFSSFDPHVETVSATLGGSCHRHVTVMFGSPRGLMNVPDSSVSLVRENIKYGFSP